MANTLNVGNGDWATKENSLLGYNSENGNYKPLAFDFTRASNGTFVNKSGLIETAASGVPRIDFLGNTSGALKLEPQRTNIVPYSEDFSNVYWSPNSNALKSLSSNLSPDGTANAYRVEAVTGTQVGHVGTTTIGTTITHSIWVRRISGSTTFNMVDVNNIATSVNITSDWQRFSLTSTATSTALRSYFRTTALGDVVEIYGAQLEEGSYATSYIPTQGSAVTRVADVCSQTPPSGIIGQTEGVLYAEISAFVGANEDRQISISDGGTSNRVAMALLSNGTQVQFVVSSGGSITVNTTQTIATITSGTKIAFAYKANDFKIYANGLLIASDTSGAAPTGLNTLGLDRGDGGDNFYGNLKDLKLYNTALTDAELIALTS
jgi:hypothetical protein